MRSDKPLGTPGAGFKFFTGTKDSQVSILLFPQIKQIWGQISVRNPYTVEVVSLCWRAPELLLQEKLQKARKKGLYNTKLDLWAAGCIMAEMLRSGRPILPGTSEIDQLMKILRLCGTPEESDWDRLLTSNFTSDSAKF